MGGLKPSSTLRWMELGVSCNTTIDQLLLRSGIIPAAKDADVLSGISKSAARARASARGGRKAYAYCTNLSAIVQ